LFEDPRDALREELHGYDRNLRPLCHDFNDHKDVFACLRMKDHPFFGVAERHEHGGRYLLTKSSAAVAHASLTLQKTRINQNGQHFWLNKFYPGKAAQGGVLFLGRLTTGSVRSAIRKPSSHHWPVVGEQEHECRGIA
jgi:hypothetical protein